MGRYLITCENMLTVIHNEMIINLICFRCMQVQLSEDGTSFVAEITRQIAIVTTSRECNHSNRLQGAPLAPSAKGNPDNAEFSPRLWWNAYVALHSNEIWIVSHYKNIDRGRFVGTNGKCISKNINKPSGSVQV